MRYPDERLHRVAAKVPEITDETRILVHNMAETMYAAPGIGLAAVQIGVLKRLIVIDISKEKEKKNPLFLINPEIIFKSKKNDQFSM